MVWNGTSWQNQATGVAGSLVRVTGRTKALAFGVVLGAAPHVVRYQNAGFTEETLPQGTGLLQDIWMAPNGRTFAVGDNGTIVSGP